MVGGAKVFFWLCSSDQEPPRLLCLIIISRSAPPEEVISEHEDGHNRSYTGWVNMCFFGVGKNTSRDTKSLAGGGAVFCFVFWDTLFLASNTAWTFYLISVRGDDTMVLQLGSGNRLHLPGPGPGQGRPGCVLCVVDCEDCEGI